MQINQKQAKRIAETWLNSIRFGKLSLSGTFKLGPPKLHLHLFRCWMMQVFNKETDERIGEVHVSHWSSEVHESQTTPKSILIQRALGSSVERCRYCPDYAVSKDEYKKHLDDIHRNAPQKCEYCFKVIKQREYKDHKENNCSEARKYYCNKCQRLLTRKEYKDHMRRHRIEKASETKPLPTPINQGWKSRPCMCKGTNPNCAYCQGTGELAPLSTGENKLSQASGYAPISNKPSSNSVFDNLGIVLPKSDSGDIDENSSIVCELKSRDDKRLSDDSDKKRIVPLTNEQNIQMERKIDATRDYAHSYREEGRFGSHPSHDGFDDESKP